MTTQATAGAFAPSSNPSKQSTLKTKEHALIKFGLDPDKIIQEDGRYWMTAEQLGIALGYNNPRKGVMKILERHRKELRPFISVVKLGTQINDRNYGAKETTIFNTGGQYRIALFANTPKAEKFRTFVVNMLEALEREEFVHVSRFEHWSRQVEIWREELIALKLGMYIYNSRVMNHKKYNKMVRYRKMGLTQRETAKLLDISRDIVQQCERIPRQYKLRPPIDNRQSTINNQQSSIPLRPTMPKTLWELQGGAA